MINTRKTVLLIAVVAGLVCGIPDAGFALKPEAHKLQTAAAAKKKKLKPANAARGKRAYTKRCYSCHALASRFQGYKKGQITSAQKSIPEMKSLKVAAQELVDLVKYFQNPS